ncbi:MAG: glutamate decarboxylase [Bryobacteraceae bacterium]
MTRVLRPMYARRQLLGPTPRHAMPEDGMPPDTAYQLIHDELILDGSSRFNLATFCGTWMEQEARHLMSETFDKNMIDKDEYPQTAELEMRCVHMLADLWHAPDPAGTLGTSTIGSSEACMLGGLALKWRWRERMRKLGKPVDRPNLVLGTNTQVCWHKFARYWDVEERQVPLEGNHSVTDPERAAAACDENTIGVVSVLGSTFTGEYENVGALSAALDLLQEITGLDIPIHVDGASGAFVAPFIQPDLLWDFRLPRVKSVNTSGHKYGLVYPGVGWIVWREAADLDPDLIFNVDYLGGTMPTLAINFSRPASQVVAQYYNLIRLGKSGYRAIHQACQDVAVRLAKNIAELGPFELLSDGRDLPVFAWTLKESTHWSLYDLADRLRDRGWQVPAYRMPAKRQDVVVQRIVVRNGFTHDLADMLLRDIRRHLDWFAGQPGLTPTMDGAGFHH